MPDLQRLSEVEPGDAPRAGDKAWRCAQMLRAGLPVPGGIILLAGATEAAFGDLHQQLLRWPAGTRFAVRSSALDEDSAEHSFAGMHETRLNVAPDDVADAVCACWRSWQAPRALTYRRSQGIPDSALGGAVLVQAMVPAVVSGVVFTCNPVTGGDEIVVNAAAGLGEALVSGLVPPDQWHTRRSDLQLLCFHASAAGGPTLLTEGQVRELSALALRIEQLFGGPQDIEWCHDGRQFWIVQARPATGVRDAAPGVEWTRANLREVLPDLPPPQVTGYVRDVLNFAWRRYGGRMWAPEAELGPMVKVFFGRPYFNVAQFRYAAALIGAPAASTLRALGHQEISPQDEVAAPRPWKRFLRALPDLARLASYQFLLGPLIRRHVKTMRRRVELYRRVLDAGLDERVLLAGFETRIRDGAYDLNPVFALGGVANVEEQLRKLLGRTGYRYEQLVLPVLAAGEKSVSSQQAFDLLRLAKAARAEERARAYFMETNSFQDHRNALAGSEFLRQFDRFLAAYGHRGVYETDWSRPRYSEDPAPLLAAVAAHLRAPSSPDADQLIARQERAADEAWRCFERSLRRRQRIVVLPLVRALLRRIKRMYVWREMYRSEIVCVAAIARRLHLALAERLVARGLLARPADYFLLTHDEVRAAYEGAIAAAEIGSIVAQRQAEMNAWRPLQMPLLLRAADLQRIHSLSPGPAPAASSGALTGMCVSPGLVEGEVIVMHTAGEFGRMRPGAILVAPATDPSWTPLFTLAAGVVVEIGGLLSHASTVAREYGLPALANVKHATQLLHDGDRVRLDAAAGTVEVLGRPSSDSLPAHGVPAHA